MQLLALDLGPLEPEHAGTDGDVGDVLGRPGNVAGRLGDVFCDVRHNCLLDLLELFDRPTGRLQSLLCSDATVSAVLNSCKHSGGCRLSWLLQRTGRSDPAGVSCFRKLLIL